MESRRSVLDRMRRLAGRRLIDTVEEEGADLVSREEDLVAQIRWLVEDSVARRNEPLSQHDIEELEAQILNDVRGLGPLAPLMADPDVSDVLVNGPDEVWVDRRGRLERTAVRFDDETHLRNLLDRIISAQGRQLDVSSPSVDARMSDGSRLHAIIPPLCMRGPIVSIRRFRVHPFSLEELVTDGVLSHAMAALLTIAVQARLNIVISGSAAAGKTTFLNALSRYIPEHERIVTIEETSELRLQHAHVITLETKPANFEGVGGIGLRELLRNALRMRADRIIVGEVRGEEVFDMLQAMNVGHDGSLTTVHANNPEGVARRLETLAMMGEAAVPREAITDFVASAIQLVVHMRRLPDGQRRVTSVREVFPANDGRIDSRELFAWKPRWSRSEASDPSGFEQVNSPLRIREILHEGDTEFHGAKFVWDEMTTGEAGA